MDITHKYGISQKEKDIHRRDANAIINYLKNKLNYSDNAIAGIMGNIAIETGRTYNFQEKQPNASGYGLFQMETAMQGRYNRWLNASIPAKRDSMESQLLYMDAELNNKLDELGIGFGNSKAIRKSFVNGTPEQISKIFMKGFENPNKEKMKKEDRKSEAINAFKVIQARETFDGNMGEIQIDPRIGGEAGDAAPQYFKTKKIYDPKDNHSNAIDSTNPDYDARLDGLGMDERNPLYREEEIV